MRSADVQAEYACHIVFLVRPNASLKRCFRFQLYLCAKTILRGQVLVHMTALSSHRAVSSSRAGGIAALMVTLRTGQSLPNPESSPALTLYPSCQAA